MLVKCRVQNIKVDISFNQIGGLKKLCFLEEVDRFIGKEHLFKQSIILIKAWCYYENSILGAQHRLISSYGLETLILYISLQFGSSLNSPLAVLYKFLDYFSQFDWDNYCISIHGPVSISSLPEIVVEAPETDGNDLLHSKEFLDSCKYRFSVPLCGSEENFTPKCLNIIDPLKENNNLGRSVTQGNLGRIRSAFTCGFRELGAILSSSQELVGADINSYFTSTLHRHATVDVTTGFTDLAGDLILHLSNLLSALKYQTGGLNNLMPSTEAPNVESELLSMRLQEIAKITPAEEERS